MAYSVRTLYMYMTMAKHTHLDSTNESINIWNLNLSHFQVCINIEKYQWLLNNISPLLKEDRIPMPIAIIACISN